MSKELIEKLREYADGEGSVQGYMADVMHESADALEAKAAPVGEREAFEAWHTDTYGAQSEFNPVRSLEWGDLGYVDCTVQAQFHAFCGATRAAHQRQQAREVVMPPRMSAFNDDFPERHTAARWYNQALDDVARLNKGAGSHE